MRTLLPGGLPQFTAGYRFNVAAARIADTARVV